jgi:hypothetical protein
MYWFGPTVYLYICYNLSEWMPLKNHTKKTELNIILIFYPSAKPRSVGSLHSRHSAKGKLTGRYTLLCCHNLQLC